MNRLSTLGALVLAAGCASADGGVGLQDLDEATRLITVRLTDAFVRAPYELPNYLQRNPEPLAAGCEVATTVLSAVGVEVLSRTQRFDGLGRLVETERVQWLERTTTTYSYGPEGLEEETVESNGDVDRTTYVRRGGHIVRRTIDLRDDGEIDWDLALTWAGPRLLRSESSAASGRRGGIEFDWDGELLQSADDFGDGSFGGRLRRSFAHDAGRLQSVALTGGGDSEWSYGWDGDRLVGQAVHAEGRVQTQWTLAWEDGRPTRVEVVGGAAATFQYDEQGRLIAWDIGQGVGAASPGRGAVTWGVGGRLEAVSSTGDIPARIITWENNRPVRVEFFQLPLGQDPVLLQTHEHEFDCS